MTWPLLVWSAVLVIAGIWPHKDLTRHTLGGSSGSMETNRHAPEENDSV